MAEFNPDAYLKKQPVKEFDPDAYLNTFNPDTYLNSPASQEEPSAYEKASLIRESEKGGAIASQPITDSELAEIARQTNTDPARLKEFVPYFGVMVKGDENFGSALKAIAGHAGKMAFGIPQKLIKMAQDDNYEKALDIVGALAGQKQSYLLDIANIAGGGVAVGGRIAKALSPSAKPVGKAVGTAAEGVGIGAVAGAASADKGEELEGAVGGAVIGAGVAALPVTYKVMKSATNWANDKVKKGLENIRANGAMIDDAYNKVLPDRAEGLRALSSAGQYYQKRFKDFNPDLKETVKIISPELRTKALTAGTPENKLIRLFLGKKGDGDLALMAPEELDKAMAFLKLKSLNRELTKTFGTSLSDLKTPNAIENAVQELDKLKFSLQAVSKKGFESKLNPFQKIGYNVMKYASDSKPFLQVLDDRYGTSFELIADNASKKLNLVYGAGVRKWADDISDIAKVTRDPKQWRQIIDEVESGNIVSPQAAKVKTFFDNVLTEANELGAGITKLKAGYFPKIRKSPVEYIRSYRDEAKAIQNELNLDFSDLDTKSLNRFMKDSPRFKTLVDETLKISGLDEPTADNFKQGFLILSGDIAKARQALNLRAFAAQKRSNLELPEWAREIDPAKAATRWVTNTYKYLSLKDEIAQLAAAEKIASKAKDKVAAEYLRNLRLDWMGGRIGTVSSSFKKLQENWQIKMDSLVDNARKNDRQALANLYEGAKDIPDLFFHGQNNIYQNVLGLSPKAAVQNLASFYTQNFPELGHAASVYYTGKALPKLGNIIRKGELGKYVYEKGLIDKDWTGEAVNIMSGNLRKSMIRRGLGKAGEKYSQAVMSAFKASELTARTMTALIADDVAKDMLTVPALRNKILMNMKSSAYRRALQNTLEKRDVQGTVDVLTDYLNSNNMFNYNKINQAEFARSLGPMFAIFSKWPTMALGQQLKEMMSGGGFTPAVVKNMRLLYLPALTMKLADAVIDETIKPEVGTERYENIMGKKGLAGMMLLDATPTGVTGRGGLLESPAVRTGRAAVDVLFGQGQFKDRFSRAYNELTNSYVPVLPLVRRVIERDIPMVIYNEPRKK